MNDTSTPKEALNWPDEVRLKMIEKSQFYQEPQIYQYGYYDGYQLATSAIEKLEDKYKIELSNYAYQMDMAKRERDKAEEENKRLQARLEAADKLLIEARIRWSKGDHYERCESWVKSLKKYNSTKS